MAYRNYINIEESILDKPVYRIMTIDRLLEALIKKQLVLVKPKNWDDPFENALLASAFELPSGELATFAGKDSVYGQCWTHVRESDAMWRIYSEKKDGVRVTSTPRKLLEALSKTQPNHSSISCFIGKVTYLKKTALFESLSKIKLLDPNGSGFAESLLFKRNEFRHEKEVRLIYSNPHDNCKNDTYPVPINPNELFDKIMFDPRMNATQVKNNRALIRRQGFVGKINQSTLYRAPKGWIFKL